MPSERRRGRGCLVTLVVLIVLALLLSVFHRPLGRFALDRTLAYVAGRLNVRLAYERVSGDMFSRAVFHDLFLAWNGDSMRVRELTVDYEPFRILKGLVPISDVSIAGPRLWLGRVGDMALVPGGLVPVVHSVRYSRLGLRRLVLVDGAVYYGDSLAADSIELVMSAHSHPERVRFEVATARARLANPAVWVRQLSGTCFLTPDSLLLDRLELSTDHSRLSGDMGIAFDGWDVHAEIANLNLDLSEFTEFDGRFRATGQGGREDGRGQADLEYAAERLKLGKVALPVLRGRLRFDQPEVRLTLAGGDSATGATRVEGTLDLERLDWQARVELRGLPLSRVESGLPDVAVDATLEGSGHGLDSVEIAVGARSHGLAIDTLVAVGRYVAGAVTVDRFELRGAAGRAWAEGTYREGRFAARCMLDSFDLGLAGRFAGIEVAGRADGVAKVAGTVDSLTASGGVRVADLRVEEFECGRGMVEFDLSIGERMHGRFAAGAESARVGGVALDAVQLTLFDSEFDLRLERPEDRLLAQGMVEVGRSRVDGMVSRFQYATAVETLETDEPFRLVMGAESLLVEGLRAHVAGGVLELSLRRGRVGLPQLDLMCANLNLQEVGELFRLPQEMSGIVNVRVSGRDTLAVELTAGQVEVPSLGIAVKRFEASLWATDTRMEIERCWLVSNTDTSWVAGHVGYSLADSFAFGDANLEATLADPGAWVLEFLKDIVHLREGLVYGSVGLSGSLTEPNLTGRVRVMRGTLWVPSVSTLLERVTAEITLHRDVIVFEKLSGTAGTGLVIADGFVDLGTDWLVDTLSFRIRSEDATISPMPEVYAVIGGELMLAWAPDRPFSINGTVDVKEALLAFNLGQQAAGAGDPGSDSLVYDIHVRGDRGIWLRNRVADIELSVDLLLKKTMTGETYTGRLATRQGNIYYLDRTLRVTRGEIRFDNISELNPGLDILAELPVRAYGGRDEGLPDKVLLALTGTLEQPEFGFSSEPAGWDENDIVTYLILNVTADDLDAFDNREAIASELGGRLLGYFQNEVSKQVRDWLSLDALRFEGELTGDKGYKVTVGKYVGHNLYVTYSQNFTGEMQPEVRVEYYLDRRNEIVGERSGDGRYSLRYRFKFRY